MVQNSRIFRVDNAHPALCAGWNRGIQQEMREGMMHRRMEAPRVEPKVDRSGWRTPWVQLKTFSFHPCIYPGMIRDASPDAGAGSWVQVYDRSGNPFGVGLYNPRARVPLRILGHTAEPVGDEWIGQLVDRALDLRQDLLKLPETTEAYRVIHSDGDNLSGLVVDRFGDVLSIEVHSLGIYQRLPGLIAKMHARLGTKRAVVHVDDAVARWEGITSRSVPSDPVKTIKIREHGVRFEVNLETGHKTGFFCDQRENRKRLAGWTKGLRVLDLCCYTGGFALAARVLGEAAEVTGVDLDEAAIAQAKRNANLNQVRVEWVHCDAFSYARQMARNGLQWDVVIADPPKLVLSRDEFGEGLRKYEDMNSLAVGLVRPGGLFVTCSCSGLLSPPEFEAAVIRGAHRQARRLQILDRTGPGMDHPVMSNCPESQYLKVLWSRVYSCDRVQFQPDTDESSS